MDGEDDRLITGGLFDLPGEAECGLQFGADLHPGADLLGEDPPAPGGPERVELTPQLLSAGGAAGVADPDRCAARPLRCRFDGRALDPAFAGVAVGGNRHPQLVAERGDRGETGGVVGDGGLAGPGPAGTTGRYAAGGAVVAFDGGGPLVGGGFHRLILSELSRRIQWL